MNTTQYMAELFVVIVMISLCGFSAQATAQKSKKFTKSDLPTAVLSAFQHSYPNAVIKGVGKEKEHGTTYYEIESIDGKTKRDILYTIDGGAYEIEEGIAPSTLPDVVKKAIQSKDPKSKIDKAEKVTHGTAVQYEIHLENGKKRIELVVDGNGKILNAEKKGAAEHDEDEENE